MNKKLILALFIALAPLSNCNAWPLPRPTMEKAVNAGLQTAVYAGLSIALDFSSLIRHDHQVYAKPPLDLYIARRFFSMAKYMASLYTIYNAIGSLVVSNNQHTENQESTS